MRKNNLMLPILAVIVGIAASAFTVTPQRTSGQQQDMFWYTYNQQTGEITTELGNFDEQQAEVVTGCDNTATPICAKGYSTQQTGLPKQAPAGATDLHRSQE